MGNRALLAHGVVSSDLVLLNRLAARVDARRNHYLALCAGCHGAKGQGKPSVIVALAGNSTVRNQDPHNLLQVVLHGVDQRNFPDYQSRQAMPGFTNALDDAEVAQLVNYLRVSFGGQKADVAAGTVAKAR